MAGCANLTYPCAARPRGASPYAPQRGNAQPGGVGRHRLGSGPSRTHTLFFSAERSAKAEKNAPEGAHCKEGLLAGLPRD